MHCYNNEMSPRNEKSVSSAITERSIHSRILSMQGDSPVLDTIQLNKMEQSFRVWVSESSRKDVHLSRMRILLIFLLIRYTGAKLHEVLALNPFRDIDYKRSTAIFVKRGDGRSRSSREVQIPVTLSEEIHTALKTASFKKYLGNLFHIDPGHVRRKFYERARACGFPPASGSPDVVRKSRAVELLQSNMPLPVVQKILGHTTPNMTASYVTFADNDMQQVAKYFIEKESRRKTSARNSFFGKISSIRKGDIQSAVEMTTIGGDTVTTIITNDSLAGLGLKTGSLITAEVKAPWVVLQKSDRTPESTAENRFAGTIVCINKGRITSEVVVRIADGTDLCSVVSAESTRQMGLRKNDRVWVTFNSFSVVLHIG